MVSGTIYSDQVINIIINKRIRTYEQLSSEEDFSILIQNIRGDLKWSVDNIQIFYQISNRYKLPIHLTFIIISRLKRNKEIRLKELSSSSFYSICRDILLPATGSANRFSSWFGLNYPQITNMNERIEWYLSIDNGLSLRQKISLLTDDTSYKNCGVGIKTVEKALSTVNLIANSDTVNDRKMQIYEQNWPAAVASFINIEQGDLTASEVLLVAEEMINESNPSLKRNIIGSMLRRMGKLEVYFLCKYIHINHQYGIRHYSLTRAISKVFHIDYKIVQRIISMQSVIEIADMIDKKKPLKVEMQLRPFVKFKPMLAGKWSSKNTFPVIVEGKYDGMRISVHKQGKNIALYTRNKNDVSHRLPDLIEFLSNIILPDIIMDGELIAVKFVNGKQTYLSINKIIENLNNRPPHIFYYFVVFDLIFMGMDLTSFPLSRRNVLRDQLINSLQQQYKDTMLVLPETTEVQDNYQIMKVYDRYLEMGLEGAIIKNPNSLYEFNSRGPSWKKMKPKENIDVVITGIEPLNHNEEISITSLRIALLNMGNFIDVAIIPSISHADGFDILRLVLDKGLIINNSVVNLNETIQSKSDQLIHRGYNVIPEIVVTIDFLGLFMKDKIISMRSPRFMHIRLDKTVNEINTIEDLYKLYTAQENK